MNCERIKDELLTLVGTDGVPRDIREHLDTCVGCRAFWFELSGLSASIGSDEDFYLSGAELESAVNGVDARLDRLEIKKVTDVRSVWYPYVPAAAAVVLLLGISIVAYLLGWFPSGNNQAGVTTPDFDWVSFENGDTDIIDNDNIDYVMYQSAACNYTASRDLMYDDLSEEELEYLDENFDVGEML